MVWETGVAALSAVLSGMQLIQNKNESARQESENRKNAIGKVMNAAVATRAYLYDSRELHSPSRETERELSKAWQEAANAIQTYDRHLFDSSQVKSLGWADPGQWEKLKGHAVTIKLDEIIKQCEWLRKQQA